MISCAGPYPNSRLRSGGLCAELPAHHVGAHAFKRLFGLDHVPPRAVHLPALLVEHLLVAEHTLERRAADEDDRHEELRVEPETDLLAHLGDPVGREPLLPVRMVREIGGRQPRDAPVAYPPSTHVVLPAERGERERFPRRARRRRPPESGAPLVRRNRNGSPRRQSRGDAAPRAARCRGQAFAASSSLEPITVRCPHEHL